MLVDTPQITWHGGEAGKNAPILSIDAHPLCTARAPQDSQSGKQAEKGGSSFVLATAGTDAEVRLWVVSQPLEEEEKKWEEAGVSGRLQSFVGSLGGHERGVNVVRFSPDGLRLASGSDGGTVVIWSVNELGKWSILSSDRDTQKTILRGATEDIYDLCWSPDCKYIACGSIDRRTHVWEVTTKRSIATMEDHANYVQGTAWDPLSKYMATQSSDRSCRVYQLGHNGQGGAEGTFGESGRPTVKCCNVIKSCVITRDDEQDKSNGKDAPDAIPGSEDDAGGGEAVAGSVRPGADGGSVDGGVRHDERDEVNCVETAKDKTKPPQRRNMFVDETVTSFFRRLTWTPDGAFLITPTAQNWDAKAGKTRFCTYLFTRGHFIKPAVRLPGLNKPSVAVRCNPRLFALKSDEGAADKPLETPVSDLQYRVVFAVVSLDAVVIYDTEHSHPLTVASGLHYSGLTDACWSADGLSLFVSSQDGYVSTFHFKPGELGETIPEAGVPLQTRRLHPVIYGWRPEAGSENVRGTMPPSAPPAESVQTNAARELSTPRMPASGTKLGSGDAVAPSPGATFSKPKKKIAPTLLSPMPAAPVRQHAKPDSSSSPQPSIAVPPTPSCAGGVQGDRKKRRIVPTLIHDGTAETATPSDDGLAPGSIGSAAPGRSTGQDDKASKKKRLAPTLVSAL